MLAGALQSRTTYKKGYWVVTGSRMYCGVLHPQFKTSLPKEKMEHLFWLHACSSRCSNSRFSLHYSPFYSMNQYPFAVKTKKLCSQVKSGFNCFFVNYLFRSSIFIFSIFANLKNAFCKLSHAYL